MWTVSDYPALGLISGLSTHGYKACVVCRPKTDACSVRIGDKIDNNRNFRGRKIIYGGRRRWICHHHPYRTDLSFNGKVERRKPPIRMSGERTIRCADSCQGGDSCQEFL